jgi:signal peptide peptidase SppA
MPSEFLRSTAWVLEKSTLKIVDEILMARFSGQERDLAAIEASLGRPLVNERSDKPYEVVDGVAVISMIGLMGKRMNMMSRMSGGVSTELMQEAVEDALTDPRVIAVVVKADTPGGSVDGVFELADWQLENRGIKPVLTYVDGMLASGGYLYGAVTDQIWAFRTAQVGSVSVVRCHYDRSGADEKAGVKRTFITSGEYKRLASDAAPLDKKGKDYLQDSVDRYHAMFIEMAAVGRGITPELAQEKFGDGKVHLAAQALEIGMIDHIGTLAETIDAARAAALEGQNNMNKTELKEKFPEVYAEIMADGQAAALVEFEGQVQVQGDALVTAEQARLTGLYAAVHGEVAGKSFSTLVESGLNATQMTALEGMGYAPKVAAAPAVVVDPTKAQILANLEDGDNTSLAAGGLVDGPADYMAAVDDYAAQHGTSKTAAMKAVNKKYPALRKAYQAKQQGK